MNYLSIVVLLVCVLYIMYRNKQWQERLISDNAGLTVCFVYSVSHANDSRYGAAINYIYKIGNDYFSSYAKRDSNENKQEEGTLCFVVYDMDTPSIHKVLWELPCKGYELGAKLSKKKISYLDDLIVVSFWDSFYLNFSQVNINDSDAIADYMRFLNCYE